MNISRVLVRALFALVVAAVTMTWSARASAYAWMVRHDYAGCNQCHADPSGGGLLTEYGRAQGELLLRSHYTPWAEDEEPGKLGEFLLGAFPLPESVLLGGDYRLAFFHSTVAGTQPT